MARQISASYVDHQIDVDSINPRQGWVEQDPLQLLRTVEKCISATVLNLSRLDIDLADCVAVGIANQVTVRPTASANNSVRVK